MSGWRRTDRNSGREQRNWLIAGVLSVIVSLGVAAVVPTVRSADSAVIGQGAATSVTPTTQPPASTAGDMSTPAAATSKPTATIARGTLPDFNIAMLDGGAFRLSEHRGRVVAVFVMAAWCSSCILEAKSWAEVYPQYHERGVDLLVVSGDPRDDAKSIAAFREAAGGIDLPWAVDHDGTVLQTLNIQSLDQTVIIDPAGHVVYQDYAATPPGKLREELEKVLAGTS